MSGTNNALLRSPAGANGRLQAYPIGRPHVNIWFLTPFLGLGQMEGLPGSANQVEISGVSLILKISLRLMPSPDGASHHLCFDLSESDDNDDSADPVLPLEVIDPNKVLDSTQEYLLRIAAAKCLSYHAAEVSYVFASVKSRGTTTAEALATPHCDWCNVVIVDGRQYLAILGKLSQPKEKLQTFDSKLVAKPGSAYLALSLRLFSQRFLLRELQANFRPRARFNVSGLSVRSENIQLPSKTILGYPISPVIKQIAVAPIDRGINCKVFSFAELPLGMSFEGYIELTMPFQFNARKKQIEFLPDKAPIERHKISCTWLPDVLGQLIVEFILSLVGTPLHSIIGSIAKDMQKLNASQTSTVKWNGVRDFEVGDATMDGCLLFRDVRQ